jgi:hypothetical protein
MALKYVSMFAVITNSPPGEVASTGSESELNVTYLADFLTRGFPVFLARQCFAYFFIYTPQILYAPPHVSIILNRIQTCIERTPAPHDVDISC